MRRRTWQLLAWTAAVLALLGVFALYTRPQAMVALSDLMWACFN
ncbi:MAG: hypothetical protein V4864_19820 [Pseudomonadota bacterium]